MTMISTILYGMDAPDVTPLQIISQPSTLWYTSMRQTIVWFAHQRVIRRSLKARGVYKRAGRASLTAETSKHTKAGEKEYHVRANVCTAASLPATQPPRTLPTTLLLSYNRNVAHIISCFCVQ